MDYLHIKNLEKYHPGYKDRSLIWCKAYFSMINSSPEFEMLCEIDKWRLIAFIMLELQLKKPIPLNEGWLIRKGFDNRKRRISATINMLHNFIEVVTEDSTFRNETVTQSRVDKSIVDTDKLPSTKPLLLYYSEVYKQTVGKKYIPNYAKDGALLKKVMGQLTFDEIKGLIDKFFASTDSFITSTDRGLGVFKSQINKLQQTSEHKWRKL